MIWIILLIAGLLETYWAYQLKCSHGFTLLMPSLLTIIGMIVSFYLLAISLKTLPLGIAYAVWTGIGIIGTTIIGFILFKETITFMHFICITLIIIGIAGLNILSGK